MTINSHWVHRITRTVWRLSLITLLALLFSPLVVRGQEVASDEVDISQLPNSRTPAGATNSLGTDRRASAFGSPIYSTNDTVLISPGTFDRPNGDCVPNGWTGRDLVPLLFTHVTSSGTLVKNGVGLTNGYVVNMGSKAIWVGADATTAPDEVNHWVHSSGYGNDWSQRIVSPTFDLASNPNAVLTFNGALELGTQLAVTSITTGLEFLTVQALRSNGTWATAAARFIRASGADIVAKYVTGKGVFRCEVGLGADGNDTLGLAANTQVRIVVQTNISASNEDGGVAAGEGAAVVDSLRLRDGGTVPSDLLSTADFEDGTTGVWTLSALNGSLQGPGPRVRDLPALPNSQPQLASGFDYNDPTCVWKWNSPSGDVGDGALVSLTSPWLPSYRSTDYGISYALKFATPINNRRFWNVIFRGKSVGDTRPRVSARTPFIFFGGNVDSDAAIPFSYATSLLSSATTITPALGNMDTDSTQVEIRIFDRYENATFPRTPIQHHFFDELAFTVVGGDSDHDGVIIDGCPFVSAAGQDADRDGCVDPGATMRHVESWPSGPLSFRLSANGDPRITDGSDLTEVQQGFLAWEGVGGSGLDLVQQADTTLKDSSPFDGVNLVTFEDSRLAFPPNVLAVTPTLSFLRRGGYWDDMKLPGEIADADLIFNPAAVFKTPTYEPGLGSFDLRSVTVHEAGHFLGLSHSGVLDATMFFVLQPEQGAASLEDDDRAAVAAAYPGATLSSGYGTILGSVLRGGTLTPVPGALVTAVKLGPGLALEDSTASDYTDEEGDYALRRLPPGNYAVRVTPLDGEVGGYPLTAAYISARVEAVAVSDFDPEWYDEAEGPSDDPNELLSHALAAGQTLSGVNLITNIDVVSPTVVSVFPANAATNVRIDAGILVDFSERMDPATLQGNFKLHLAGANPALGGNGALINGGRTFVFTPSPPLLFNTSYELELLTGLKDRNGVALVAPLLSGFATETRPTVAITDIQPRSASEGSYVTILGAGFDPGVTNEVTFTFCGPCTPVAASGSSVTSTSMVVQVPAGAVNGDVAVTVNAEASNPFTLTVLPPSGQVAPSLDERFLLPPGFSPTDVAIAPDKKTLYAVGQGGFATVNLDPLRANFHVPIVEALGSCYQLVLSPDGYRAYATRRDTGDVILVDADPLSGTFRQKLAEIEVAEGASPSGIVITGSGRRAYLSDQYSGTIYTLDTEVGSAQVNEVIGEAFDPEVMLTGGLAIVPGSGKLLFTTDNQGSRLYDFGTASSSALSSESSTRAVTATPSGQEALFLGTGTQAGTLLFAGIGGGPPQPGAVLLGGDLRDLAINPQGKSAFVVNAAFNLLQVVDVDPLSSNYHAKVAETPTDGAPSAVSVSSDGSLIAVAETGGGSVALFGAGAVPQIVRVTPPTASPGDQVSVTLSGSIQETSAVADLGLGASAPLRAPGANPTAVSFVVPSTFQRDASLQMAEADDDRTLASLFKVVDPIAGLAPQATGVSLWIGAQLCGGTPTSGALRLLRTSPDGRLLAVGRERSCDDLLEIHRVSAEPGTSFPALLTTVTLSASAAPILDLAFTPDGRKIWASIGSEEILEVDADPSSVTFGAVTAIALASGEVPRAFIADPMGRSMVVAISNGDIELWDPVGHTILTTVTTAQDFATVAVSPDGRLLLTGNVGRSTLISLDSPGVLTTTPDHSTGPADHVRSIAVTGNGSRAVGLFDNGNVAVWSLESGSVGNELYYGDPVDGSGLSRLIPAPDGVGILAGCADCNDLHRLDVGSGTPSVTTASIGQPSLALARSHDGRRLWAANWDGPAEVGSITMKSLSEASVVALVAGADQSGAAAATLPTPVRVRVLNAAGDPQVGVAVRFAIASAQGSLDGQGTTVHRLSDANGEAQVLWTLANAPGTTDQVDVTALGVSGGTVSVMASVAGNDAAIVPQVVAFGPSHGASGIRAGTSVYVRFNQKMDSVSVVSKLNLTVNGVPRNGPRRFLDDYRVLVMESYLPLPFSSTCILKLAAGALDQDGQATALADSVVFTTEAQPALSVASLYPPATQVGSPVVISGQGFSLVPAQNVVLFNGLIAPVTSATFEELRVNVPPGVSTGPVTVTVGGVTSNPLTFTLPSIPLFGMVPLDDVPIRPGVRDIAITPDGQHAYITNPTTSTVSVMQLVPPALLGSITVGLKPQGIAILPEGHRAYVANTDSDNLSVIDTDPLSANFNKVIGTVPAGDRPVDVAVSPIGPQVVVVNDDEVGTLSLIDADSNSGSYHRVVSKTNTGSGGKSVAISADGGRGFVLNEAGEIAVVDLAPGSPTRNQVVKKTDVGSGGSSVTIKADGTMLLVVFGNGDLAIVDVAPGSATENQVVKKGSVGTGGTSVAISADGGAAFVSNGIDVVQLLIQLASGGGYGSSVAPGLSVTITPVDTIHTGVSPMGLVFDPGLSQLYVVNQGSGTLSVVGVPGTTSVSGQPPRAETALSFAGRVPASGELRLRYNLRSEADMRLEILDVTGRRVRVLERGLKSPGWHLARWDGTYESGSRAGSGIYFVRMVAGDERLHRRVVWLR